MVNYRRTKQPLPNELRDFIEGQPRELRETLSEWDIIDGSTSASFEPLVVGKEVSKKRCGYKVYEINGGHIAAWRESMKASNISEGQWSQNISRVVKIVRDCGFSSPMDIRAEKVEMSLAKLRREGLGGSTSNKYLGSMKKFTKWLLKNDRIQQDPLIHLDKLPEQNNPVRRALSEENITGLLHATMNEPQHYGLTGFERTLLYRVALNTGARSNEMYTLKRSDFLLEEEWPVILLRPENTKNRKADRQPIPKDLAAELKTYFDNVQAKPSAPAFPRGWKKTADMLRDDLAAAGIEYMVDGLKADFHALRHTFGTRLAKAGVAPQLAMKLMRHSSINLTMKYYVHLTVEDKAAALEKISYILQPGNGNAGSGSESSAYSSKNSDKCDQNRVNSITTKVEILGKEKLVTPGVKGGYGIVCSGAGDPVLRLHALHNVVVVWFIKCKKDTVYTL